MHTFWLLGITVSCLLIHFSKCINGQQRVLMDTLRMYVSCFTLKRNKWSHTILNNIHYSCLDSHHVHIPFMKIMLFCICLWSYPHAEIKGETWCWTEHAFPKRVFKMKIATDGSQFQSAQKLPLALMRTSCLIQAAPLGGEISLGLQQQEKDLTPIPQPNKLTEIK